MVMPNPLPPGAIPAISRLKRGGKYVGNYGCLVKGKRVNLETLDYELARERAVLAVQGAPFKHVQKSPVSFAVRSFGGGSDDWAADLASAVSDAPSETPPPEETPPQETPTTNVEPDAYLPPNTSEPAEPEPPKSQSSKLPPGFMSGIARKAAMVLVELQIMGQEWLAKRWAKVQMGTVPTEGPNAIGREAGQELWEQALVDLIPSEIDLPPYLLAPIIVAALTVPVQIAGASPLPEEEQPQKKAA